MKKKLSELKPGDKFLLELTLTAPWSPNESMGAAVPDGFNGDCHLGCWFHDPNPDFEVEVLERPIRVGDVVWTKDGLRRDPWKRTVLHVDGEYAMTKWDDNSCSVALIEILEHAE